MKPNKIKLIFTILIALTVNSCSQNQKYNDDNQKSRISQFRMQQKSLYSGNTLNIESPLAIIDNFSKDISIEKPLISIVNNKEEKILMESEEATLNGKSNQISASGKIKIKTENNENNIKSKSLVWDINSSKISLFDDINLYNKYSDLQAGLAIYDIDKQQITFLDMSSYTFRPNINSNNYYIKVIANKALFESKQNVLIFDSDYDQVETNIYFYK